MTEVTWAAVLSLFGSLIGTFAGILTSARLTEYRLSQLEKKMNEMGKLVGRIYQLEQKTAIQEERLSNMNLGRVHNPCASEYAM